MVKTTGSDENLEEVQQYGLAIIEKCMENDLTKVFADESALEYKLGAVDTYALGEFLSSHLPRLGKAALFCRAEFIEDARFFETTVSNRGLYIRVFTSKDEAMVWLNS